MLAISQVISDEIRAIVRAVLDSDAGINRKVGMNTLGAGKSQLYEDVLTSLQQSSDVVVSLLVNHYIDFIESGRRKGAKMPPFNAIADWCKRKGLPTDNSTVWAICMAISRDGIAPRPIMSNVFQLIDERFDMVWGDRIFDEITAALDRLFG